MKKVFILFVATLLLFGYYGCKKDSDENDETFEGTWIRNINGQQLAVNFQSGGTLIVTFEGDVITGTYSTSGNDLTVKTDDRGLTVGNYSFSISGDELTISVKSDNCADRAAFVPGVYKKS